jgi:hypothetical protein
MPDEPVVPSPETPSPNQLPRQVGTAFAGETTHSMSQVPRAGDETVLATESSRLEVVGDFEVLGKLGRGGMGTVYRARQVSLDRQVALKILPAQLAADADFVRRFQREARVGQTLTAKLNGEVLGTVMDGTFSKANSA